MKELNPLKTYSYFYAPKINSEQNLNKINCQKGRIIPLNSNIKKNITPNINLNSRNSNIYYNNKKIGTPIRNNYSFKSKISNINEQTSKLNIVLPNMLNNYNKINTKTGQKDKLVSTFNFINNKFNFFNQLKDINLMRQIKNKNDILNKDKSNNYLNIYSQNNQNNIENNKENIESVEWMIYNKKKNGKQKSINVLDEIYNLKKYDEYTQMNKNISHLIATNNYNNYIEFKKKHSKDYLSIGNSTRRKKRESLEIKNDKEKSSFLNEKESKGRIKRRKLINYNVLSIAGSHKGIEKINQDCSLIIQKINDCNNLKIFGVFDGHGTYGDKISQEICNFFEDYFNNKLLYEEKFDVLDKKEKAFKSDSVEIKNNNMNLKLYKSINLKKENILNYKEIDNNKKNNIIIRKLAPNSKNSLFLSRFKNIKSVFNKKIEKNTKLQKIYNILSKDNYSQIYNSFKKIDIILHQKYSQNKICDGTGTALSFLIIFNDYKSNKINYENNCNKIISVNLGNTKSILITEDNKIKELNICHTPNIKEERIRIEKNGGKIDRIDWLKVGPLRIWFQDKKYPGLTITRSLGDFEAEPLGILTIPDIKEFDIDKENAKIVVIATNGVWEFLTNDKIMDIVLGFYNYGDIEGAAKKIIEISRKLWEIKNPKNIPDLTVIILFFK